MSAQRLTDAQIAAALRAHLPAHARADVRMRIAAEVSTARQRQPLPSVFALLSDADPDARRRVMLLAAAMLLAVGIVAAAVVGAYLRRDEPVRITTDPAVDAPAFVGEAFAAHRFLPPMTLVARMWDLEAGSPVDVQRFYIDGTGRLRHECCEGTIILIGGEGAGSTNQDGSGNPIWLLGSAGEPGALPAYELATYSGFGTPDCPQGWRYIGPDRVIDRPAHHVACPQQPQGDVDLPDLELWLDAELGITLRSATWGIQMDENNEPFAPHGSEMAVESIVFGEPGPALFEPPPDLRAVTVAEYNCQFDPPSCTEVTAPPPTLGPATTPVPANEAPQPPDVPGLVAATLLSYAGLPAMEIVIEERGRYEGEWHRLTDGSGALREERYYDLAPGPPIITLWIPEGFYETWYLDDGTTEWRRLGDFTPPVDIGFFTLGLPELCTEGWEYLGLDVVVGWEAWHIACGPTEFWIDRERLLVVRRMVVPDALHRVVDTETVLRIDLGAQPPELFELPEDAVVAEGRG